MSARIRLLRLFCLFVFFCGNVALNAQSIEDEVSRLEDAIIENRLKVTRWRATVRATYGGPQGEEQEVVGVDTYIDGSRRRKDVHRRYDKGIQRPDPDRHTYRDVESYSDTHFYEYSSRGKVGRYGTALVVTNRRDLRRELSREEWLSYDPRAIGNAPVNALSAAYSVPGILRLPGRLSVTVEDDVPDDGTKCKKVTSLYGDEMGVGTYWVSVAEGHSIRRYEGDGGEESMIPGFRVHTDITVVQWKDSGIWLPKTTHYERYENNELVMSEDAEIEFLSVNEPLDPDLFEPISFGITADTSNVYLQPNPSFQRHIWDGERIVPVKPALGRVETGPLESGRGGFFNMTTVLLMNASFFVVLAFVFFAKGMRSKMR